MSISWKAITPVAVTIAIALLPAPNGLAPHAWYFFAIFAGVIVGLMTEPLPGGAIGLILIEVVNRQSIHWSMDLHVPWASLALFALGLIALAALAAVLAGRQAMRQDAVLAVREDW